MKIRLVLILTFINFSLLMAQQPITLNVPQPDQDWPNSVTYHIFVRSFCDGNGDGIGDLKGITARWECLRKLGAEAVLISPIFASPSYHKYDVTDYYKLSPEYGNIESFQYFIKDAHAEGFKVILDIPLNHCSNKHPWFIEAAKNPASTMRNYFVWSNNPPATEKDKWHLPKDEKGNTIGKTYYYGFFSPEMPDWNYDNAQVVEEAQRILKFWIDLGVDGFRLDAAQHIFKDHNKNIGFWNMISAYVKSINKHTFLVGEVDNSSDMVAPYLKPLDACFDFDLSREVVQSLKNENASNFPMRMEKIITHYKAVNKDYKDAIFLTNHDQNRVMSEVGNNVDKAKLAANILFTLPGIPYIYYGEEIGMKGEKPDEFIREPMLFAPEKEDEMRPKWMKPKYSTDKTVESAMVQIKEDQSLWNHYSRLISMRKENRALQYGQFENSSLSSKSVLAYYRIYNQMRVLIINNVSATAVTLTKEEKDNTLINPIYQTSKQTTVKGNKITLAPYSTIILTN